MISTYILQSAAATHRYHSDSFELAQSSTEGLINETIYATWGGKGAIYAGFGEGSRVTSAAMLATLEGEVLNPLTQSIQRIGGFRKDPGQAEATWRHPPGVELVFSGPKSFSVLALSGHADMLRSAMDLAVGRTMAYAEQQASYSKVSVGGKKIDRLTGNLVYSVHPHETSRHRDEQYHLHVPVGTYQKFCVEPIETRQEQAQAAMTKERPRDEQAYFEAAVGKNMDRLEASAKKSRELEGFDVAHGIAHKIEE